MTALFLYIAFENSKEALAYYEEVFGATDVKRLEVGEEQASHFGMTKEDAQEATMHAEFEVLGVKCYVLILLVALTKLIMAYHY